MRGDDLPQPLELWGGIECSHVQVGDVIRDQLRASGHWYRPRDLDRVAALGIRRLRMPVIWGAVAAQGPADFDWPDRRMARARALGIDPIIGLLHHGWGPGGLTPVDAVFAPAFAAYAAAVARRYPWVRDFTPVNEPVTTARFAGLYGIWHPHGRDEAVFLRLAFGAIEATAAAMAAIRRITPLARLIQTEDVGRSFAPPALTYQADYENARRFLGLDLLCGRVDPGHPFHARLTGAGISMQRLSALVANPCPPDVIGLDQYLTSDRWLDPDLARHPHAPAGGNGRDCYVDVAAAHRPDLHGQVGVLPRLRDLHDRYRLPLAVTENHNGCTREEQLRWLHEAWCAARAARAEGIDVRAVTSWALFGAYDWNSLLCRQTGFYESGAYDLRHRPPRLTAVGRALAALCRDGDFDHPVLDAPGWWRHRWDKSDAPDQALLAVQAPPDLSRIIMDAADRRRLTLRVAGVEQKAAPTHLGRLVIESVPQLATFCWSSRGRERLHITADIATSPAFEPAFHATLDLILDQTEGRFRLTKVQSDGQYRVLRLGPASPDGAIRPPVLAQRLAEPAALFPWSKQCTAAVAQLRNDTGKNSG